MRCASESLRSLSANTRLRGRDNLHLLDQSLLLLHGPHTRPMVDLPLSLLHPSLYRGIGQSPPLRPKKPSGTSSPSRPACDFTVLQPCPVPTTALSSLCFLSLSLSPVWVAGVRPAVVLFYNPALFVLRLICPPLLCFMPDAGTHQPHLYLIVSIPTPVPGSHLVSTFSYHHYPVAVCPVPLLSCSRSYRMCILFRLRILNLFDVYIFYLTFLLPLCLYSPLGSCSPVILCYLTYLRPVTAHSQNH